MIVVLTISKLSAWHRTLLVDIHKSIIASIESYEHIWFSIQRMKMFLQTSSCY
ncbi:hypothetical protein JHK82_026608 [Glycine max]|uniref:Uncharacterized protein n=2 Tax=Glycine subgen. Soja TaxID=1462606 RepID=K7LGU7_SOYBN|nr:hypothetical protein JHK87_026492 [Glycine soja]KAG4995789.1 hypothetical protein JHK85_027228 [Glycine max]KAG5002595.1 hypothetical protein JHK86_026734 [Glycine max]KAG5125773.1 hypothetical protein JHK82_026608 [Glycine max]KAG5150373.1 hypothetical protein JHK84_026845 [Glycine max]